MMSMHDHACINQGTVILGGEQRMTDTVANALGLSTEKIAVLCYKV